MPTRKPPQKATLYVPDTGVLEDAQTLPVEAETFTPPALRPEVESAILRSVLGTIRRGFDERYCPWRSESPEAARWLQLYNEHKHNKTE